jgi:hypothetical protein
LVNVAEEIIKALDSCNGSAPRKLAVTGAVKAYQAKMGQ